MPPSCVRNQPKANLDRAGEHQDDAVKQPERRQFLRSAAAMGVAILTGAERVPAAPPSHKVLVGGHGWVYAAPMPRYDYTPVIEQIFSDFQYAGIEAFELMDVALRHDDSVERIGGLSHKYSIPILGTSFGGNMWDRSQHAAILEAAETVVPRLSQLGDGPSGPRWAPRTHRRLPSNLTRKRRCCASSSHCARRTASS